MPATLGKMAPSLDELSRFKRYNTTRAKTDAASEQYAFQVSFLKFHLRWLLVRLANVGLHSGVARPVCNLRFQAGRLESMRPKTASSIAALAIATAAITSAPAAHAVTPQPEYKVMVEVTTTVAEIAPYMWIAAVAVPVLIHNQDKLKEFTWKGAGDNIRDNADRIRDKLKEFTWKGAGDNVRDNTDRARDKVSTYVEERVVAPVEEEFEKQKKSLQEVTIKNATEKVGKVIEGWFK
jgi:hypothetical protein